MAMPPMPPTDGDNKTQEGLSPMNTAVLDQRVTGVEYDIKDLKSSILILGNRMDDNFNRFKDQLVANSKTQWPLLISIFMAAFTFTSAMGYLTLQPIKDRQYEMTDGLKEVRLQLVPRGEHAEKWAASAREFDFIRTTSSERYKAVLDQIEDIRRQYREIYGAADIIRDLNSRLKSIESQGRPLPAWDTRAERR